MIAQGEKTSEESAAAVLIPGTTEIDIGAAAETRKKDVSAGKQARILMLGGSEGKREITSMMIGGGSSRTINVIGDGEMFVYRRLWVILHWHCVA